MTEQEFMKEAKIRGVREENIHLAIETWKRIKEHLPNTTLEEMIETAIRSQEKIDNMSEFISVD